MLIYLVNLIAVQFCNWPSMIWFYSRLSASSLRFAIPFLEVKVIKYLKKFKISGFIKMLNVADNLLHLTKQTSLAEISNSACSGTFPSFHESIVKITFSTTTSTFC